jgi:hypothetical protein
LVTARFVAGDVHRLAELRPRIVELAAKLLG